MTLAFEPEINNVVSSVMRARRLLDEIGSPWLKVVIDPANLLRPGDMGRLSEILDEAFDWLGPDIVLAHAKEPIVDETGKTGAERNDGRVRARAKDSRSRIDRERCRSREVESLRDYHDELSAAEAFLKTIFSFLLPLFQPAAETQLQRGHRHSRSGRAGSRSTESRYYGTR